MPVPSIPLFPSGPGPVIIDNTTNHTGQVYLSDLSLTGEYVKIINGGSTPVPMTGWKLSNSAGQSIEFIDFPTGDGTFYTFTLMPHSTVTVYSAKEGTPTSLSLYWPEELWNDAGDTAYLYNPQGDLVSSITR
jgi:hypothetical protein